MRVGARCLFAVLVVAGASSGEALELVAVEVASPPPSSGAYVAPAITVAIAANGVLKGVTRDGDPVIAVEPSMPLASLEVVARSLAGRSDVTVRPIDETAIAQVTDELLIRTTAPASEHLPAAVSVRAGCPHRDGVVEVLRFPEGLTAPVLMALVTTPGLVLVEPHYAFETATSGGHASNGQEGCELLESVPIEHANPDPLAEKQWGLSVIGAPRAWKCVERSDVPIAIIDTGIMAHPEVPATTRAPRDVLARRNGADADGKSHGTKVAALMAAAWNGQGIMGVMNGGQLIPVRAFQIDDAKDGFACGNADEPCARVCELVEAIDWAVEHGARVINASWAQRGASSQVLKDAIEAVKDRALFVVAAGQERIDLDADPNPFYPAAWGDELPNVLTVMETNQAGAPEGPYGATTVHLAAPGIQICTTRGTEGYDVVSGTSFATALVSAAAAMAWSTEAFADYTPEQMRTLLVERAAERAARDSDHRLAGQCQAGAVLDIGFLADTCS